MFGVLLSAGIAVVSWLLPKLLAVGGTVAVSMTVITPILNYLQSQVMQRINGMPADALAFFQFCGVPEAVSVVFAAYTMALGMRAAKAAFQRSGAQ